MKNFSKNPKKIFSEIARCAQRNAVGGMEKDGDKENFGFERGGGSEISFKTSKGNSGESHAKMIC